MEVAKVLYAKNARVYIGGRSEEHAQQAIQQIRAAAPEAKGSLEFLHIDLSDLSSIKTSVDAFKEKESKLHILWSVNICSLLLCCSA